MTDRNEVLQSMQREVTDYLDSKGWRGPGSAAVTFGDTMALLHSEVSEALEAYRDHKTADATQINVPHHARCAVGAMRYPSQLEAKPTFQGGLCTCEAQGHTRMPKPEGVGSEFADILIRLLDDCDRWGVDLAFEFERKMAYNRTRAYQHGGRTL